MGGIGLVMGGLGFGSSSGGGSGSGSGGSGSGSGSSTGSSPKHYSPTAANGGTFPPAPAPAASCKRPTKKHVPTAAGPSPSSSFASSGGVTDGAWGEGELERGLRALALASGGGTAM